MSWQKYVKQHANGRSQVELAAAVGVSQAAVSRWIKGVQGVDAAVAVRFARAVDDTPLAALVAAGFLTEAEAKVRPSAAPDYSRLTNDELLELVHARMREEGEGRDRAPATKTPEVGPAKQPTTSTGRKAAKFDAEMNEALRNTEVETVVDPQDATGRERRLQGGHDAG